MNLKGTRKEKKKSKTSWSSAKNTSEDTVRSAPEKKKGKNLGPGHKASGTRLRHHHRKSFLVYSVQNSPRICPQKSRARVQPNIRRWGCSLTIKLCSHNQQNVEVEALKFPILPIHPEECCRFPAKIGENRFALIIIGGGGRSLPRHKKFDRRAARRRVEKKEDPNLSKTEGKRKDDVMEKNCPRRDSFSVAAAA